MVEKYIQLFQDTESGQKELLISPNVSLLKIEVDGSGSLSANAMLDRESELYLIGAIKTNDFSKVTVMNSGLYSMEVSGYYKMFFTSSGNANVYIKTIC